MLRIFERRLRVMQVDRRETCIASSAQGKRECCELREKEEREKERERERDR